MLQALQDSAYAEWVRASWGWALALTLHAFGVATVAGLIFIIALRLGGFFRTIPPSSLLKLFPFVWGGIVVQVASGFSLWVTKPSDYLGDVVFDIKITCVILGGVATFYFQKYMKREAPVWDADGVSKKGKQLACLTAFLWATVIIMGRLTAYLGTLYG